MEDFNAPNQRMPIFPKRVFEMDQAVGGVKLREGGDNYSHTENNSFGAKWSINSKLINDHLAISILCKPNHEYADGWGIRATARIVLEGANEESMEKSLSLTFNEENRELGIPNFVSWAIVEERFMDSGHIFVRVFMDIEEMIGTERKGTIDFSDPETPGRDGVLVVEGKKFYVVKERLADWSPYFQVMFFSPNFSEANQNKIELKDLTAAAFQLFLEHSFTANFEREYVFLSSMLSDDYIDDLLMTSDMFGVDQVRDVCEDFLVRRSKKSLKEKLRLAHRHDFKELKKKCVEMFDEGLSSNEHFYSVRDRLPVHNPDFAPIYVDFERMAFEKSKRLGDPEVVEMVEAIRGAGNNQ